MELCQVIDSHLTLARVALGYRLIQLFHHGPIIVHYQHNIMTKQNHIDLLISYTPLLEVFVPELHLHAA